MIEPLNMHYAFTNPATVHDEEALTSLELAGRQGAKINEVIKDQNALRKETAEHKEAVNKELDSQKSYIDTTIPKAVSSEVSKQVNNGTFDAAIEEHIGNLEARVDSLLENVPEGGTTMDAEVVDIRTDAEGYTYASAGESVRAQSQSSKIVKDSALVPVYGEPVQHTKNALGTFFDKNGNLTTNAGVTHYGLCVIPVEKGQEYHIGFMYNTADIYSFGAIADSDNLTGVLQNPVFLPSRAKSFIAPKTGFLYVNYATTLNGSDKQVLFPVTEYKPALNLNYEHTFLGMVAHKDMTGYGPMLVSDGDCICIVAGQDYGCYTGRLEAGCYVAEHETWLSSHEPTEDENFGVYLGKYNLGDKFTVTEPCYFMATNRPPSVVLPCLEENDSVVDMVENISEMNYTIKEEVEGTLTEWCGLTNEYSTIHFNGDGVYNFMCFPVEKGKEYVLYCDNFSFPSNIYPLYAFATWNEPYTGMYHHVKNGSLHTANGKIEHRVIAPLTGYLLVSHTNRQPSDIKLYKTNGVKHSISIPSVLTSRTYNKLLTVGDSLSGNSGLWQPKFIELMNIPEYTTAGGAGLTLADQGADVNTIYNHVMSLDQDEAIDLITLWGGFNDFNSAIEISTLEEQLANRDATTFIGGALDCLEKLLELYPLKQIVMLGTTPFEYTNNDWHTRKNSKGYTITDYVEAFKEVANYYSIPFYNLLENSGFNTYNYETYYLDQGYWLHPNGVGNERLAYTISGFVKSLG